MVFFEKGARCSTRHKVVEKIVFTCLAALTIVGLSPQADALTSYDPDGDHLIEIRNLDQLNAMRYDLDGDGVPESGAEAYYEAFPEPEEGMGCARVQGSSECRGYELKKSLDFDMVGDYKNGLKGWSEAEKTSEQKVAGWVPIGTHTEGGEIRVKTPFTTTFNGNGNTIKNLYIYRSVLAAEEASTGLFGYTNEDSSIERIGLEQVKIEVRKGVGVTAVGALVGESKGVVKTSYTTGIVQGVISVGGLVGKNEGTIENVYSTSEVRRISDLSRAVGGLVGFNSGTINKGYATGTVVGTRIAGGLVGKNNRGSIANSYTTGSVFNSIEDRIGGAIGENVSGGTLRNVFWNKDTSGRENGVGGDTGTATGVTDTDTYRLQAFDGVIDPTRAGISRSVELQGETFWNFGDKQSYPVLTVAFKSGNPSWQGFGRQIRTAPELLATDISGSTVFLRWNPVRQGASYKIYCNEEEWPIAEGVRTNTHTVSADQAGCDGYQVVAVANGGEPSRSGWRIPVTLETESGWIHPIQVPRFAFDPPDFSNLPDIEILTIQIPEYVALPPPPQSLIAASNRELQDYTITNPTIKFPNNRRGSNAPDDINTTAIEGIEGNLVDDCEFLNCGFSQLFDLARKAMTLMIWLATLLVTGVIVYAGVLLTLNIFLGGPDSQKQKAQGMIKYALIGLFLILAAWVIVSAIFTLFGANFNPFDYGNLLGDPDTTTTPTEPPPTP